MPNSVVIGRLRAVDGVVITLGGNVRIIVPPTFTIEDYPIGCSLTVTVHLRADDLLIAERIDRTRE